MPQTRASAASKKPEPESRSRRPVQLDSGSDSGVSSSLGEGSSANHDGQAKPGRDKLEGHIEQVQVGVRNLKRQLKSLQNENDGLKFELESAKAASVSRKRREHSPSEDLKSAELRIKILERTVKDLQTENSKQKRRLDKYKAKQLRAEAEDLKLGKLHREDSGEDELDAESRMRKLLRKFSDLMLASTLPDDLSDECPICFDNLIPKETSAFPCQHTVCNTCFPSISKGADETVQCPVCRARHPRDEVELVHMLERDRWDQLLVVAQAWDAFDVHRGAQATSEEEAEENFLTDGDGTSSSGTGQELEAMAQDTSSEIEIESVSVRSPRDPSTPPPGQGRSYSESPMKEKRKMLEQLAEVRASKRRK
ncbi:hypothetical protein B0H34DRAFT_689525 [Crassisporium funariophilum]|nr:hypothetical protein B0H34DRAFT_689525 [Crassisporium funariophilum]